MRMFRCVHVLVRDWFKPAHLGRRCGGRCASLHPGGRQPQPLVLPHNRLFLLHLHAQAPVSYTRCAPLVDAYLSTHISLDFRPEEGDGLIFFNGESFLVEDRSSFVLRRWESWRWRLYCAGPQGQTGGAQVESTFSSVLIDWMEGTREPCRYAF